MVAAAVARPKRNPDTRAPYRRFGEIIAAARERVGLTQKDLATRVGLTQSGISLIELGRMKPEQDTFHLLVKVLDGDELEWLAALGWLTVPPPDSVTIAVPRDELAARREAATASGETLKILRPLIRDLERRWNAAREAVTRADADSLEATRQLTQPEQPEGTD